MSTATRNRAVSGIVDSESRGKAIKARRLRHGIKSIRQFAEQSGVSREAITAAEEGLASDATFERLEAWLSSFEEETGANEPPAAPSGPSMVTFRLGNLAGDVDVVVQGPIEDIDKLRETVERLLLATEKKKDQPENE